jgi:hypothetical protein
MKDAKLKNREATFIEPVMRGNNNNGARVGVTQNNTELTGNR